MAGRPRNDEIDARVLEAAVDALALHGYRGLRIDDVASAAGVAKTTIYRRWPTLMHLAVAAVEYSLGPREAPHTDDALADLLSFASGALSGLGAHGGVVPAIGVGIATGDDEDLKALYRARIIDPVRITAIGLVERAMAEGALAPGSPEAAVDAVVGALVYRVSILGEPMTHDVAEDVLALVLRALRPDPQ